MADLNKVLLIGNLTRDPVSRATTGGTPICELGLATNRRYRTASGQDGEDTCFVDIDVFGNQADACSRYLRKGSLVYVEGRLRYDQWQDRSTGENRSRIKIVAERVQFLDRRDDSRPGGDAGRGGYDDRDEGGGGEGGGYSRGGGGGGGYSRDNAGGDRGGRPQPRQRGAQRPFEDEQPDYDDAASENAGPDEAVDDIPF